MQVSISNQRALGRAKTLEAIISYRLRLILNPYGISPFGVKTKAKHILAISPTANSKKYSFALYLCPHC